MATTSVGTYCGGNMILVVMVVETSYEHGGDLVVSWCDCGGTIWCQLYRQ